MMSELLSKHPSFLKDEGCVLFCLQFVVKKPTQHIGMLSMFEIVTIHLTKYYCNVVLNLKSSSGITTYSSILTKRDRPL